MNSNTIAELEQLKESLLRKIDAIDQTIRLYKSMSTESNISPEALVMPAKADAIPEKYASYDKSSSYKHKIAAILRAEGRFLTIKEISEIIVSIEPDLDPLEIKKALGSAKSVLLKEKAIVKYVVGNSNNNSFYGSKNWLDEKGEPKPKHKYNEDILVSTKEEIEI